MSLVGSTISLCSGKHLQDENNQILPRLNTASRPKGTAAPILEERWFKKLAKCAEQLVLDYYYAGNIVLHRKLMRATYLIPHELYIIGTIFLAMDFVGNLKAGFHAPHMDLNGMVYMIVNLGAPTSWGHTI